MYVCMRACMYAFVLVKMARSWRWPGFSKYADQKLTKNWVTLHKFPRPTDGWNKSKMHFSIVGRKRLSPLCNPLPISTHNERNLKANKLKSWQKVINKKPTLMHTHTYIHKYLPCKYSAHKCLCYPY